LNPAATQSISAVAEDLCFTDASSFSRVFKREFGCSPARRARPGSRPRCHEAARYRVLAIWAISFARSILTSIKVNEASAPGSQKKHGALALFAVFWPIISDRDLSGSLTKEARYVRLSRRLW
jgi:hypothetical protein